MSDDFFGLDLPLVTDDDDAIPSGWRYLSGDGMIKCTFSSTKAVKMGQGANRRTHTSRNIWFIEQVGRDRLEARMLTDRDLPSDDDAEYLRLQGLIADFTPELTYYEERVVPALINREESLGRGRSKPSRADNKRARTLDERNVRGLFGLALVYLERGEVDRAKGVLSDLVQVQAEFKGKDQFLFNEFGIVLRKSRLFPEAVEYFRRALGLCGKR